MLQIPSVITMTICATRMYRSLSDFAPGTMNQYDILSFVFIRTHHLSMTQKAHLTISAKAKSR